MPLFVHVGTKKKHINLNNYHNWHYQVRNKIKQTYKEIVNRKLQKHSNCNWQKVEIQLIMIRGDKRRVDRSNVLCLHEKFFCDAIVDLGIIPDDNDKHLIKTTYLTGEPCKIKPRVEIKLSLVK